MAKAEVKSKDMLTNMPLYKQKIQAAAEQTSFKPAFNGISHAHVSARKHARTHTHTLSLSLSSPHLHY
jgi:hypothetical protein